MRFLRRALTGIFLVAVTLAILAYAGNTLRIAVQARMNAEPRSFPQRERVVSVNLVTLTATTISPDLSVFGELRSRRTLDLRASVGGTVTEVSERFVEGGTVTAGEWLLRIDPIEAEAALARVRADLADAEADARDAARALELANDELAAARQQAALRDQALVRQRDLQSRGIGTAPELEAAELALSGAAQAVLSRRQALAQAQARVDQTATTLTRVGLNLAEAERTLAGTEIRAEFDGSLAAVGVAAGGRVTANEQVAQLIDPAALDVAFRVSTSQYANLLDPAGRLLPAPVGVELDVAGVDLTATGRITREGARVGEGQTGRLIFAELDPARGFRPGDFVTVHVAEPALTGVALLPATAVAADGTVLVLDGDDRLRLAAVELLRRQGNDVIVRAPDLEGARVVAERNPLLGPGIKVRPITLEGMAADIAPGAEPPALIALSAERRARLVAYIEGNDRMPTEAKSRLLSQIDQPQVPADVVARLESRMGS